MVGGLGLVHGYIGVTQKCLDVVAWFSEGDSNAGVDVESDVVHRERVVQGRADAFTSDDVVLYGLKSASKNPDEWEVEITDPDGGVVFEVRLTLEEAKQFCENTAEAVAEEEE